MLYAVYMQVIYVTDCNSFSLRATTSRSVACDFFSAIYQFVNKVGHCSCSQQLYHRFNQPCTLAHKLLLISRSAEGRRLNLPEHTCNSQINSLIKVACSLQMSRGESQNFAFLHGRKLMDKNKTFRQFFGSSKFRGLQLPSLPPPPTTPLRRIG